MVGKNGDAIDQLDQLWDETIRGIPSRPSALDPGLASTVRRLHTLNETVVPDSAFARRLWTDLSQPIAAVNVVPNFHPRHSDRLPRRSNHTPRHSNHPPRHSDRSEESGFSKHVFHQRRIPRQARNDGRGAWIGWRWGFAQVLTVAILLLSIGAGYAAFRLQPTTSNERLAAVSNSTAPSLYAFVFEGTGEDPASDRWDVTPLDPTALADRPPGDADTADLPAWTGTLAENWAGHWWTLSADGSTFAVVETWQFVNGVVVEETTIGVYDARTGAERVRFELPAYVQDIRLSHDGARLVVQAIGDTAQVQSGGPLDPPEWYAVDTADGQIVAKIESNKEIGWHADSWIDPTANRLYRLFIPYPRPVNNGPGPARLVANDLTTGTEIGQLELPDVRSGVWGTGRTYEVSPGVEYPIFGELRPGAALSPDGKTLAIVHADEDAVTLIDAERLVVERTEPLTRPTGWGDRLLRLLTLSPNDAAAKGPGEGTDLQAVFAADGRHLYVFGFETAFDKNGAESRSLGLRLIDLDEAEIVADAEELADGFFSRVIPSPNGRDLYVIGSQPPDVMWSDGVPTRLWRLDAATLEVLTKRDFTETPQIILSPAVPDGRGQLPPGAG